jgi:hypothetical protein
MLIVETAVSTPIRIAADAVSDTTKAEGKTALCSAEKNEFPHHAPDNI